MKIMLLGAIALASVSAFAQSSPSDVCQNISRYSAQSGTDCAIAISRGYFDNTTLEVANAIVNIGSTSSAVKVMQLGANRYLDDDAAAVCKSIARYSGSSAATCAEVAFDNAFEPALARVALSISNLGSSSAAVTAIQNARNASAHPQAAEVCNSIARYSGSSAAECILAVINKDYFNGSERVCKTLADQGSSTSAVRCMRESGVQTSRRPQRRPRSWDNRPGPQMPGPQIPQGPSRPGPGSDIGVILSGQDIRELNRMVRQARNAYDSGDFRKLGNHLNDLEMKMNELKMNK